MSTRSRSSSYQKVEQNEEQQRPRLNDEERLKRRSKSKRAERVSVKIHAVLWIIAAGLVLYGLDVFQVMFRDNRVNRMYFNFGLMAFGVYLAITLYLAIYLPYVKKITLEWSVYCPRMIPAATMAGVSTVLGFTLGLWPVWGFLTPGILFVLIFGTLMTSHFLPAI